MSKWIIYEAARTLTPVERRKIMKWFKENVKEGPPLLLYGSPARAKRRAKE